MHSMSIAISLLTATLAMAAVPPAPLKITNLQGKGQPAFRAKSKLLVHVKCDHRVCVKIRAGKVMVQQCMTQRPNRTGRCIGKLTAPAKPGRYQVEAYRKGVKVLTTNVNIH